MRGGVNPWRIKPVAYDDSGTGLPLNSSQAGMSVTYRFISLDPKIPARLARRYNYWKPVDTMDVEYEWVDDIHLKVTRLRSGGYGGWSVFAKPDASGFGKNFLLRDNPPNWEMAFGTTTLIARFPEMPMQPDNDDWSWE